MKQQRILVLSQRPRAESDLPLAPRGGCRVTYCSGDSHDISAAIERIQQPVDWVLIDGAGMGGDEKEFLQSLRAIGVLFAEGGRPAPCRVQWNANGVLELCCGRKIAAGAGEGGGSVTPDEALDAFVFEYHAPMERTG